MSRYTSSTGHMATMDSNNRKDREQQIADKSHAQDMHGLDKDRYSAASRHQAQQDPNSQAAQVREKSSSYAGTAEGKNQAHKTAQQDKSRREAVASAERYQNTGMKYNKEAQQWQHRDTGKAVSGKERAGQVRHYGAYTEKGREGIGYGGKAPSNLEKGSDAYYGAEFGQSHARGSAWTEHQQKNDPTLDTKGLKSKWIEQRRAFDNYDPSSKATAAPATGGSMPEAVFPGGSNKGNPYTTGGNQSKGKDFLGDFAKGAKTQVPTREEELSQKYDSEVFNKEKGVVGQYFHDYAGTKPMEKGGDEAAYMKGMKDNWVERQMLGDKWDKEMMTWEGDKAQHPSGAKAQSTKGALHMLDYINTAGKQKEGQSNEDYYKGMKDAWIDKQQLGNQWDRDMITWEGDKAQHPSGMKAQSTKGAEYAFAYLNKHGTKPKDQSNEDYYKGMKDQWIGEQTGFAAGVKNKIAEVQGKGKGKDFLDSKIGKTPEAPPQAAPPQTPPPQAAPPQAAPPKGGMNTGATTDLSNVQRAPNQYEKGSDPYAKAREESALKKEKERAQAEAAKPPSEPAKRPEAQIWDGMGDYAPGYGGRIGAPPGTMFTTDMRDSDGDGIDDRGQPGPGLTIDWDRDGEAASQRWAQNNPDYFERTGKNPPPMSTKPPITPPSDPYIPPSPTPPSYQESERDYIKYKNKKSGLKSDADRYALLTGQSSMGGGTTTPSGGSSTPDYSYDYGLGKSSSADADRYALLTGDYSGKSYLDKYLNR